MAKRKAPSRIVVTETRVREYDLSALLAKAAGENVDDPAVSVELAAIEEKRRRTMRVARVHFFDGGNAGAPQGWTFAVPRGAEFEDEVGVGDVLRVSLRDGTLRRAYVLGVDEVPAYETRAIVVGLLLSSKERRHLNDAMIRRSLFPPVNLDYLFKDVKVSFGS